MKLDQILNTIHNDILGDELMEKAARSDIFLNGLQVRGKADVKKIALGVTAHKVFLEQAVDWGADMCVLHHGLDTRTHSNLLPTYLQEQLRIVFQHELSVAYYHYPLDVHPEIGNNAILAHQIGLTVVDDLYEGWGLVGMVEAMTLGSLSEALERVLGRSVHVFGDMSRSVARIGLATGGATPSVESIAEMQLKNIDVFVSGEGREHSPYKLLDSGISYILGGHYATEVFGIKSLGEKLLEKFGNDIEVQFIDVPNPL